jgi:hypothetical protein
MLNENLVKPVERDTIDRRAVHHLAMIARSLRSGKPDELLLAFQGVEQRLSTLSQGVIFCYGQQRRAANGFGAALHRVALDVDEIVAQIGFAIRPETALAFQRRSRFASIMPCNFCRTASSRLRKKCAAGGTPTAVARAREEFA